MKRDGNHSLAMHVQALVRAQKPENAGYGGRSSKARRRAEVAGLATAAAVLSIVLPIICGASNLEAQTFDVIYGFGADFGNPLAGLIEASDGALYGTTSFSFGGNPFGGVFKLNKDGSGFVKLHNFDADANNSWGGLLEASDGVLYGTAVDTAANRNYGVVFKMNKDGSDFMKLHEFDFIDGWEPNGLVEASDGALYGTTQIGGNDNVGTGIVFKLNKDGSGFMKLHDFDLSDGAYPYGSLLEASDGALYGTTSYGGNSNVGVVFGINKDGSGFLKVHDFDDTDGATPYAGLLEASDGALYGTTYSGGPGNFFGVVFRLTLGCQVSLRMDGEMHTPGSILDVSILLAHNRPKTVTVPWELRLLDEAGRMVATQVTKPHTFEPGDVVDRQLQFRLPNDLSAGTYTLELAIKGMAGTKGATTTFQVIRAE